MAKPSDKAEAVARELSAEVGTNIGADDPIIALALYLHKDVEESNANQKKLVDTLIEQLQNKNNAKKNDSLLANNRFVSIALVTLVLTNLLLILLVLW